MRRKLAGLFLFVVLALIFVLIRITYINATKGQEYAQQVLSNSQAQYASVTLPFKRGDIIDRNGTVMATSEKTYNLILDCSAVNSREAYLEPTITALTTVYGLDEAQLRSLLSDDLTKDSMYQILKKNLTIEEKQAYDTYMEGTEDQPLTEDEKNDRLYVKGIWFEDQYVRKYPLGSTACDVIGFTYDGNEADWGIEGYYGNTLNGVDGRKYGYWDTTTDLGQTIVESVDGNTVQSTIDVNIQNICEKYIQSFEDTFKDGPYGTKGAENIGVVVMDPSDGAVLAMASSDPYDLNNPRDLSSYFSEEELADMTDAKKLENLNELWRNYCISDTFEPGSTYKPVAMASALESGALIGNETFVCDGYEDVAGTRIKCMDTNGHGEETLSDIIKNSCNDGMMQIAAKMGAGDFTKYQSLFNFGSRTGIDLSGEATGITLTADTMGSVDLACASFGQGFTCTMIQEAAALSAIANGGNYYQPHVVSQVMDSAGNIRKNYDSTLVRQVVSSEVSDMVRSYMKAVVDDGTGWACHINGYSMGAKTGTAQKLPRGNGKYLLSFGAFVPYENPQVLIYVTVDEPNTDQDVDSRYAQWLGRDILKEVLPYMGIYPDQPLEDESQDINYQKDFTNLTGLGTSSDTENEDTEETEDTDEPAETAPDTNVPAPQGEEDPADTAGGNNEDTGGVTNEAAGLENGGE